MKRDILANCFHDIRVTKTQMPIELPLILGDNKSDTINAAIEASISHIERVLDFSELLDMQEDEKEQMSVNLVVRLDVYSYYAALAIPFLRQVVEALSVQNVPAKELCVSTSNFYTLSTSVHNLAKTMLDIKRSLQNVSDSNQFTSWCSSLLKCCAQLVLLHTEVSGLTSDLKQV